MLIQLIYISTPTTDVGLATKNFIPVAKRINDSFDITGMILSDPTAYIQVLEGEKTVVDALYKKIAADKRHTKVRMIRYMEIPKREFSSWSMRHVRVKKLTDLSEHDAIKLLYDTAESELTLKTTKAVIFSSVAFFTVVLAFLIGGPILEARYAPALVDVKGVFVDQDKNHATVLVTAKRARKSCTFEGFDVKAETAVGIIKAHANVLELSPNNTERFVAKLEAMPLGKGYRVEIGHQCIPLWKQWQSIDLTM